MLENSWGLRLGGTSNNSVTGPFGKHAELIVQKVHRAASIARNPKPSTLSPTCIASILLALHAER